MGNEIIFHHISLFDITQNLAKLGFREQENSPLDVQFGPNDLLRADAYILAVINNQYLDDLVELKALCQL